MELQNRIKPVRLGLVSMLALVFVLSACSTGANTVETPAADQSANTSSNTTNAESASPAENSGNSTDAEAPTEDAAQAEPTEAEAASVTVSFAADVLPIFDSRCFQCHGGDKTEGELELLSYAQLMAGGKDGAVVLPGDADNSLLAQLIVEQEMPKRGPKLTPAQTQTILDWINEGALDN